MGKTLPGVSVWNGDTRCWETIERIDMAQDEWEMLKGIVILASDYGSPVAQDMHFVLTDDDGQVIDEWETRSVVTE